MVSSVNHFVIALLSAFVPVYVQQASSSANCDLASAPRLPIVQHDDNRRT